LSLAAAAQTAGRSRLIRNRRSQDAGGRSGLEDLGRVFTPFFRGDHSRARDTGRAGPGLALSKRIVEAHGGRITLDSLPGQGTTVRVWHCPTTRRGH
jgi:signal transduction histidine kinase